MDAQLLELAEKLADAREQRKRWEELEKTYLEALLDGHTAGEVPSDFTAAGLQFKLQPGRQTITWSPSVRAELDLIQARAKEAGQCEIRIGASFWRLSPAKENN